MKRKLVRAGGSLAVTLPAEVVHEFRLHAGQEVDVSVHPTSGAVIVRPGISLYQDGSRTRAFDVRVRKLLKRRSKAFRALAR